MLIDHRREFLKPTIRGSPSLERRRLYTFALRSGVALQFLRRRTLFIHLMTPKFGVIEKIFAPSLP